MSIENNRIGRGRSGIPAKQYGAGSDSNKKKHQYT